MQLDRSMAIATTIDRARGLVAERMSKRQGNQVFTTPKSFPVPDCEHEGVKFDSLRCQAIFIPGWGLLILLAIKNVIFDQAL